MSDVGFIMIDTYYSMCYTVRGGTKMKSFSSREIIKLLKRMVGMRFLVLGRIISLNIQLKKDVQL